MEKLENARGKNHHSPVVVVGKGPLLASIRRKKSLVKYGVLVNLFEPSIPFAIHLQDKL